MKIKLLFILIILSEITFGQKTEYKNELISLAKTYRSYHFLNDPPKSIYKQINSIENPELSNVKNFIKEVITSNNDLATKKYLTKPDTITLKSLYIIRGINWNLHEAEAKDNSIVLDSLFNEKTNYNELVSTYYGMLFTAIGNKNKPFNMSDANFTLYDYNLENDTEKGVFFLQSMRNFGVMIWGYMNVPKPPRYKEALKYIKKFPKYNGEPYYRFLDLNFKDFKLTTDKRKPKESFKKYYINKYIETLLNHVLTLSQKKRYRKDKDDVLLGSILKNESYWKYFDNKEVLGKIFRKIKG